MSIHAIMDNLTAHGIRLELTPEGRLRYSAPRGAMTEELLVSLRENKDEIIRGLRSTYAPPYRDAAADAPSFDARTLALRARLEHLVQTGEAGQLPPFRLWRHAWVSDPAKFAASLLRDLQHPRTPRARHGVAQRDLERFFNATAAKQDTPERRSHG